MRLAAVTAAFVFTVYAANWLVENVGPIRVWPTDLLAPAGVYVVGLAFCLRDYVQYRGSKRLALGAIAAGIVLSYFVSPTLALASACAFAASETTGLGVFWLGQRRTLAGAVLVAGVVAAAIDSLVFLWLAFHSLAFFPGQLLAKVTMSLLALPVVILVRRGYVLPRLAPRN